MLIALTLFLATGCNYRDTKGNLSPLGKGGYAWIQSNLIQPHCIRCHGGNSPAKDIDLSTYANLMKQIVPFSPEKSPLYDSINAGRMPLNNPRLDEQLISALKAWIAEGAPEVPRESPLPTPTPPPPPKPEPTYAWLNENIFRPRCLGCHSGSKPKGDVDFSTYKRLINSPGVMHTPITPNEKNTSGVWITVSGQEMPPGDLKLTQEECQAIGEWIEKGALPK